MDELELIQQSKAGNKSAMNTLLKNNYKIVFGYVMKMTGNVQLTEDIVQETMLKAMVNLGKFKPEAKFSTWLVTIATNLYRDNVRKNKRMIDMEDPDSEKALESGSTNYEFATGEAGYGHNVEEQVISRLEVHKVVRILMNLSYEKRAAFILKNYYGYKYEEIAEILGCPIGTVRSRIHNCIQQILKALERSEG